jgi:hypothetical protein
LQVLQYNVRDFNRRLSAEPVRSMEVGAEKPAKLATRYFAMDRKITYWTPPPPLGQAGCELDSDRY